MGYLKQKFRSVKKLPTWIYWFPARLMQLLLHTMFRFSIDDPYGYSRTKRGCVCVTWHNRLMFFAVVFPRAARERTVAVVSASRDGQYIADFISILGLKSLRGSSSKGGAKVQHQAVKAIRDGMNVCFTPDGPRGPRYRMKNGPIQLASLTGATVVPASVNYSRCWSFRSWDTFQVPKPFSRVTLVLGKEVEIPGDLTPETMELCRQKVEAALMAITIDPEPSAK